MYIVDVQIYVLQNSWVKNGYVITINTYYTDIDQDGHEISHFGGLPRELYFLKELYFPVVHSTEGKYSYFGTTDT